MPGMKTLAEIVDWLQRHKRSGRWREVAAHAGVTYDTVARIARGDMEPGIVVAERICRAIDATEPVAEAAASGA